MAVSEHQDYHAIAARAKLESRAFIGGRFVGARDGGVIESINPATGEPIATVAHCGGSDVDLAVSAARRSVREGIWCKRPPEVRKGALLTLAKLVQEHAEELAVIESMDSGKPIRDCLREIGDEVPACLQWYAELIDKTFGKTAPAGPDVWAMIVREPVGVVGLVLPWNFPLLMAAWKLAPALAAGCSVIVKPAEQTSLSLLRLAELSQEAGIPDGVLNVLPGLGETAGAAIGRHPDIDAVSFTGSTSVGSCFLRYAAESNLKSVGLEMGGKSAFIVLDDAKVDDDLVESAVQAAFWNAGQNCSANMRQLVHRKLHDEFLHCVMQRTRRIRIGDPLDPRTEMGPLVSDEHRSRVRSYLELGRREGAAVALDLAERTGSGSYLGPTVFTGLERHMTIAREEIFGPVLGTMVIKDAEQAADIANDTEYGLHATVFTHDIDRAMHLAASLECGTVAVNGFTEGDIKTPFGGYKRSGSLARDKGTEAMDQYLRSKTIWVSAR
ncbi:MAG TPA: aldehyde dehydrogenase [Rhodanobacteraceae bacterium]